MPKKTRPQSWKLRAGALLASGGFACAAQAAVYDLPPPGEDWVGTPTRVKVAGVRDNLAKIAYRYGLGFRQVIHANPDIAPWKPNPHRLVRLPTALLLPLAPREGIVVNISEMRLFYYPPGEHKVYVYPIAVGRVDWNTPMGSTTVRMKVANPVWRPTPSIRAEHAAKGDPLPAEVPAGPDNPLGNYALRLGFPQVLIHGTNMPMGGIGMPVTHGCVRLYPKDIEALFNMVHEGTRVTFMDQPYKLGRHNGQWYMEAHAPLTEDPAAPRLTAVQVVPELVKVRDAAQRDGITDVDWNKAAESMRESTGLPQPVGGGGLRTASMTRLSSSTGIASALDSP